MRWLAIMWGVTSITFAVFWVSWRAVELRERRAAVVVPLTWEDRAFGPQAAEMRAALERIVQEQTDAP